jgi:LysM repeat protein
VNREPVLENEPYQVINHAMTYSTAMTAKVLRKDEDLAPWLVWDATRNHETSEVVGNASRGVQVRKPTYLNMTEVGAELVRSIAQQVRRDALVIIDKIEIATFTILENDLRADNADGSTAADRRWALASLWRSSDVGVRQLEELEISVREELNLPSATRTIAAVALASAPAPVVSNQPPRTTPQVVVEPVRTSPQDSSPPPTNKPPVTINVPTNTPTVTPPVRNPDPTPPRTTQTGQTYTVRAGDRLFTISQRFNVPVLKLQDANPGVDWRNLRIGQKLVIPRN